VAPLVGQFGQYCEVGADVFAAFGVVGGQGGHAGCRHLGPALLGSVELGDPGAEGAGIPADLVQPDEPAVAVVRGVLDTLGHDRAGQLLEADAQLVRRVGQPGEYRLDGRAQLRPANGGPPDGFGEVIRAERKVGAVYRKCDRELGEGRHRVVDLRDEPGQPTYLGSHDGGDHHPFTVGDLLFEVAVVAGQLDVQLGHGVFAGWIQQQRVDLAQRVVAGHPGHRPDGGQSLARLGDLLHRDPAVWNCGCPPVEVAARADQAVWVVDAKASYSVVGHPAQDLGMGWVEHSRVLDPQTG